MKKVGIDGEEEAGRELVRLYGGLKQERDGYGKTWEFARWFLLPSRVGDVSARPSEFVGKVRNGTGKLSCERLAGAHLSHVLPCSEQWFRWVSRPGDVAEEDQDEADAWYARCTEVALAELARSNFYTEVHDFCSDRVAKGAGALYCGPGRSGRLLFKAVAPEQCAGMRDEDGRVVVFVREMLLSVYDVADLFGEAALGDGAMREEFEEGGAKVYKKEHVVLHVVRRAKAPVMGRGWESCYVLLKDKRVLLTEPEWEMPFISSRFAKDGGSFFGFPCWLSVEGELEEVDMIEKDLAKARRVAVDPRVLELAAQVGEVDLRAGGRTLVHPDSLIGGSGMILPKEWASVQDVSLAYKQLADKERRIRDAFFVPLLDLFEPLNDKAGFPSATEVMARQSQYLMQFFASFVLFADDFSPMLGRVFMTLYRSGAFPEPPDCVLSPVFHGGVQVGVALKDPGVTFHNKVSLVLQRLGSDALMTAVREAAELVEVFPGALDHFDLDVLLRDRARAFGATERGLRSEDDVERLREGRAEAAAEQEEVERRMSAAEAGVKESAAMKNLAESERVGG